MSIGPLEIGIVVLIVLLLFGAKKLPELGSSLGSGIREFGHGIKGEQEEEPTAQELEAGEVEEGVAKREGSSGKESQIS